MNGDNTTTEKIDSANGQQSKSVKDLFGSDSETEMEQTNTPEPNMKPASPSIAKQNSTALIPPKVAMEKTKNSTSHFDEVNDQTPGAGASNNSNKMKTEKKKKKKKSTTPKHIDLQSLPMATNFRAPSVNSCNQLIPKGLMGSSIPMSPINSKLKNGKKAKVQTSPVKKSDDATDVVMIMPIEELQCNPAVDAVSKVIDRTLNSASAFNLSVQKKTNKILYECDDILLELKGISDIRENEKKVPTVSTKKALRDSNNPMSMMPNVKKSNVQKNISSKEPNESNYVTSKTESTDYQTSHALSRIQIGITKLRESIESLAKDSTKVELNCFEQAKVSETELNALVLSMEVSAASIASATIAEHRKYGDLALRQYTPLQLQKLENWYLAFPEPLTDELRKMHEILNMMPYSDGLQKCELTYDKVSEWFEKKRMKECVKFVRSKLEEASDLGITNPTSIGEIRRTALREIKESLANRIFTLREVSSASMLDKELLVVREANKNHIQMAETYARKRTIEAVLYASQANLPPYANKRPRVTSEGELPVVKTATISEVKCIQYRIRRLLASRKSINNNNHLQRAMDLTRSLDVSKEILLNTGLLRDVKKVLRVYKNPSRLRQSATKLFDYLSACMQRPQKPKNTVVDQRLPVQTKSSTHDTNSSSTPKSSKTGGGNGKKSSTSSEPRKRKQPTKIARPIMFSLEQVERLESWFQATFKPSNAEMDEYLVLLNTPPLRNKKNRDVDIQMTQLRRWFNKRRCLGRPPLALTRQKEVKKSAEPDSLASSTTLQATTDAIKDSTPTNSVSPSHLSPKAVSSSPPPLGASLLEKDKLSASTSSSPSSLSSSSSSDSDSDD